MHTLRGQNSPYSDNKKGEKKKMKDYKHKDCVHCFRSYITDADQCTVPCKGIGEISSSKYEMEDTSTNNFIKYLVKINGVKDWLKDTREQKEKHFFIHKAHENRIYLHGRHIPEYRHCRFQLTYPKGYPEFLRFSFITFTIRFWEMLWGKFL